MEHLQWSISLGTLFQLNFSACPEMPSSVLGSGCISDKKKYSILAHISCNRVHVFVLQVFLSAKPHENELEIGGTTQQYCHLARKLYSTVFPEFVSAVLFLTLTLGSEIQTRENAAVDESCSRGFIYLFI